MAERGEAGEVDAAKSALERLQKKAETEKAPTRVKYKKRKRKNISKRNLIVAWQNNILGKRLW